MQKAREFVTQGQPSSLIWAIFIATQDENLIRREFIQNRKGSARLSRYRVHDVVSVSGQAPTGLARSRTMLRIEEDVPIQFDGEQGGWVQTIRIPTIIFRGVTQHLHYTSETQRKELEARSHPEFEPSEETIAVLIPIGKSTQWWQLAQDRRQAYFQTNNSSGKHATHTTIGLQYADRIHRRLYHSRYLGPTGSYDFLTYFEFHSRNREDFRRLLSELRDTARNPEWWYVEEEYEIWMTKLE